MGLKNLCIQGLLCSTVVVQLAACSGNATKETKTATTDTSEKPKWVDPQRGKFFGKVNIVQIPLTAIENHILGPVKSVRYQEYKIEGKDSARVLDDSGYNVYDKYGHLIDQNEYAADGTPKWKCTYKYDSNNKAVEWDFNFYEEKYSSKTTFTYDDKGRKTAVKTISSNGKFSGKGDYKYDDRGNEIQATGYNGDGKVIRITSYKYDSRGFQTEMTMREGDGKLIRKSTQNYDNNGDKTGGTEYADDTTIARKWTATLDNKGRTIERTGYSKDGSIFGKSKMKYDDWDNLTESVNYTPDGKIDTASWNMYFDFTYDSKGNATKETWYKLNGDKKDVLGIAERVYEYY